MNIPPTHRQTGNTNTNWIVVVFRFKMYLDNQQKWESAPAWRYIDIYLDPKDPVSDSTAWILQVNTFTVNGDVTRLANEPNNHYHTTIEALIPFTMSATINVCWEK
ncbi:hypothetical protein DFA_00347 [Cavenderia fasciculata]|uniref:Uncharacterized protein n=1 Tax=Cavenderia fasciculata TaxID=261658 RepID=F4PRD4_CACFS|nr:uncharacterized protein DFA_00347 [Cavenderia fasciculata]EGG20486.1 hypothetical protein DFA_00347 [Cavenderia fasciculata]|eukprot:XP_004358336.1 hypothetical protein DFA_00347 [Cavenderia fasciculata]